MFPATHARRLALLITALAIVLAACGGSDGGGEGTPEAAGPTAAPVDPCTLVTANEAAAALGAPVGEPERGDLTPIVSCSYFTESADILSVTLITYPNEDDAKTGFDAAIQTNDYQPLGELGDDAYNAQPVYDVAVRKGIYELNIDIITGDPSAELAQATELARTALDRLP